MQIPFVHRDRTAEAPAGASCHGGPQADITGLPLAAIVGCPNVGKSVLLNLLTGAYVAVSNYRGTTMLRPSEASSQTGKHPWPAVRRRLGLIALAAVLLVGTLGLQGCAAGEASPEVLPAAGQGSGAPSVTPPPPTPVEEQPSPAAPTEAQPAPATDEVLASADQVQRIKPADARALLDQGAAVLYDVRSTESYEAKHAAGAMPLPEEEIESLLAELPKDKILILYCT